MEAARDPLSQRTPRPGVTQWRNPRNGLVVVQLHYTVDPVKRTPEWKREASRNLSPREWRREYEIDWTAPEGEPVVPEYQAGMHTQSFDWDPSLRPLRFWDFGFVSPVCLLAQQTLWGQVRVRREVCPFNTPLDQLLPMVLAVGVELGGRESLLHGDEALDVTGARERDPLLAFRDPLLAFDAGDPAATNQTDLGASAEYLSTAHGIHLHTTRPGTEVSYAQLRALFLRQVMQPEVGPQPAILIHPDCHQLRKALAGAFHLSSNPPYRPVKSHPEKDLVDALRYGIDNLHASRNQTAQDWAMMASGDRLELRNTPRAPDLRPRDLLGGSLL